MDLKSYNTIGNENCQETGLIILANAAILAILTGVYLLSLVFKLRKKNDLLEFQVKELQKIIEDTKKQIQSRIVNNRADEVRIEVKQETTNDDHCNRYSLATGTIHKTEVRDRSMMPVALPRTNLIQNSQNGLEQSFETEVTKIDQDEVDYLSPNYNTGTIKRSNDRNSYMNLRNTTTAKYETESHGYDKVPDEKFIDYSSNLTLPRNSNGSTSHFYDKTDDNKVVYSNVMGSYDYTRKAISMDREQNGGMRKKNFWQKVLS